MASALLPRARSRALLLFTGIAVAQAGCLASATDPAGFDDGEVTSASFDLTYLPAETISQDFLGDILRVFPNGSPPIANDPDFIDDANGPNPNVLIQSNGTEVFLTFVRRDSHYDNGVGFFAYQSGAPPATPPAYTVVWSSTAGLAPGSRASLGTFDRNTRIGLVLLVGDGLGTRYYSIGALHDGSHFAKKYHKAEQRFAIGMEDAPLATGDRDMNDLIVSISTNPSCVAGPEVCDAWDNDCDGHVDEYVCRAPVDRYLRMLWNGPVHLYTKDQTEVRSGDALEVNDYFYVLSTLSARTEPFYRCVDGDAYLYTRSPTCEALNKAPQQMLGYIGSPSSPAPGSVPLYRAYLAATRDHFLTTSYQEYVNATTPPNAYVPEGIVGYVWLTP